MLYTRPWTKTFSRYGLVTFTRLWPLYAVHFSLYCSMHYFIHTSSSCVQNDWFSCGLFPLRHQPQRRSGGLWRGTSNDLKWQFPHPQVPACTPVWGLHPSGLCSLGERLPPPGWWSLASAWDGGFPASEHREGMQPSTACTGPARPAAGLFCLTCRQCALAGGPHLVLVNYWPVVHIVNICCKFLGELEQCVKKENGHWL